MIAQEDEDAFKVLEAALAGRTDLDKYNTQQSRNKLLLFAAQLWLDLDDIDDLASRALTDAPGDKSCDLLYVDRSAGLILIAQGYEPTARTTVELAKVSSLHQAVAWVFSHDAEGLPQRLQSARAEMREALDASDITQVYIWFVSSLPESKEVQREILAIESIARAAIDARYPELKPDITALEVGRGKLAEWYAEARKPILVTEEITLTVEDPPLTIEGSGWTAYTVTVPAEWLNNLYWKHEEKLFSANVRGFLGAPKAKDNINNGMRETLRDEPGNFWVYNNGITALVNDARYDGEQKELLIHGISIVNGAQTTGAVAKFKEQDALSDARIPMRFIKCGNREVVQKIIKFNNRQNAMDPADFRSNDRVQKRLVAEFQALGINSYTGGRRGVGIDAARQASGIVDLESVGRALAAYHGFPGIAYNALRVVWEEDRVYRRLFSDETTARHVIFCWSLLKAVQDLKLHLRELPSDPLPPPGKGKQLDYFERPGSIPLLVAAIGLSIPDILGRGISHPFQPNFKGKLVPAKCVTAWRPIVDSVATQAPQHLGPVLLASGPPRDLGPETLENFRSQVEAMVESISETGDNKWNAFRRKVKLTT